MLLPLFLAVPLLGAALATLTGNKRFNDAIALLVPLLSLLGALVLFRQVAAGPVAHGIGKYVGGIAIPFAADTLTATFLTATAIVALGANWFAVVAGETRQRFYPALTCMLLGGVNGALLTADLFNMFVLIEVMLLPSYGLLAMTGSPARLAAGRMFVLVNLTTSTLFLIGVSFVYGTLGTANLAALAGAGTKGGPGIIALGLALVALVIKAGVFPVHTWLPRSYPATSPAVMTLFSGLHTKVAVYAIFRIYTVVFDLDPKWQGLITIVLVAGLLVGSFAGLGEGSLRSVLAYQMVTGMPFILAVLAFAASDPAHALAAGVCYAVHHMVTVACLTLTAGAIEETYGSGKFTVLDGLARREPLVAAVFVVGAFSIIGFPPTSGVLGKALIMIETAREHHGVLLAAMVIASIGALLSMIRCWREVFWGGDMRTEARVKLALILPGAAMAAVSVAFFLAAGPLLNTFQHAASDLLDVTAYQQAVLGDVSTAIGMVK